MEGAPRLLEWTPLEFLTRFARLIAPPRKNLVRYAGALGARSSLRPLVSAAARGPAGNPELLAGLKALRFSRSFAPPALDDPQVDPETEVWEGVDEPAGPAHWASSRRERREK